MSQKLRRGFLVLIGIFAVAQVFQPDRQPPSPSASSIWDEPTLPTEVSAILSRACSDCHSNRTEWPWYSRISPISWLVAHDVDEGRGHFNFSQWSDYEPYRRYKILEEICEEVEEGEMPLAIYLPLHPEAKLDAEDLRTLCTWTRTWMDELRPQIGDSPDRSEDHDHDD